MHFLSQQYVLNTVNSTCYKYRKCNQFSHTIATVNLYLMPFSLVLFYCFFRERWDKQQNSIRQGSHLILIITSIGYSLLKVTILKIYK